MDSIHPRLFYGKVTSDQYQVREIPSSSEDSELSDDETMEPVQPTSKQILTTCNNNDCHSSSSFDSDDNIPLSQLKPKIKKAKNKRTVLKWKKSSTVRTPLDVKFEGNQLLPDNILQLGDPYKLYSHYFSIDFITEIVQQTCTYSIQCQPERPITTCPEEIERFMGILLWMSMIRQPTTRRYWSPKTRINQIADVMPLNRFEKLKRFLHFSDNTQNTKSLDKILPLLNHLKKVCQEIPMEESLSCDEQVIPFKGRSHIKTYNPKKPHKWGYKMWVLSGVSGMSYNFELFAGKNGYTEIQNEPDFGAASNVVIRMSRVIPNNMHHKLYYDNYFSSLPLIAHLAERQIHTVATIRTNRLTNYKGETEKDMKNNGRGSISEQSTIYENIDIHSVQWYDNKIVCLISDFCGTEPRIKVKRFFRSENKKKEINCPDIVREYNIHMGGVDLQDSLIGLYPIKVKSRKWYHRIFYHMLDVVVVNAWLLDRRIKTQLGKEEEIMALLTFKTVLAEQLCNRGVYSQNKVGRPRSSTPELPPKRRCIEPRPNQYIQNDQFSHWPTWTSNRERCKKIKCIGKSRVKCEKCNVHLCFNSKNNCFKAFHC